ncbi:hypothetical protein PVA45_05305 [Entomospira entomophila]|uniref:Uncharacterized protein n=1 Tax=Entomospira entomophila TaxID=2719988 RepID=A0A968GCI7_9SPIO|nr:hypothetical protein [Entomospira entomophilus]NIZ40916.1 hypothetical protein [Entomospira entomophilus]WDI35129.1 hypothetical protein PVA45_05305 [Entomospira entomophilus]
MGRFVNVTWLAECHQQDTSTIRKKIYWIEFDAFKIAGDWRIWIEEDNDVRLRPTPVFNRRGLAKKQYYFNGKRSRRIFSSVS